METSSPNIGEILMQRFESRGIDYHVLKRFIKDLIHAFSSNPEMSHFDLESYLNQMGWHNVNLDYQTYQLAKACFENGDLKKRMFT